MQRSVGAVHVGAHHELYDTVLNTLSQSGCLRACFPRPHGGPLEAVIVNTAGGIADGDQLRIDITVGVGADMVVTTPAAERVYRARPGAQPARVEVALQIRPGAVLAYLPQETILFDSCALHRTLTIDLHEQGSYLGIEALVFGRQESDEAINRIQLRDTVRLHRGDRLVLHDGIRLQGNARTQLASMAGAGGARALATIMYAAPDAAARLEGMRNALAGTSAVSGASAWDGMLVTRILAADAQALRRCVIVALSALRTAGMPRVWSL